MQLIDGACVFVEDMYDWPREKIKTYIEANSSNDFIYIKYTWQQLGLTQEWYDKQCRSLLNDRLVIRREVDLEWTKSSDNSVFEEETLDLLYSYINFVTSTLIVEVKKYVESMEEIRVIPYSFKLLEPLQKDKVYFIGCDVGGGLGKDSSTMVITDPDRAFKVVGVFKNNTININNFALLIETFIKKHSPNSILFIENNSYGKGVIDILIDRIPKSLYYEYNIPDKDKTKSNPSKVTSSITYGISTNSASRALMFDLLREIIEDTPTVIQNEELYADIKGLVYSKNGKIEHGLATHDDVLMGWLMVLYSVRFGNNIGKFMRSVADVKKNLSTLVAMTGSIEARNAAIDPVYNKGVNIPFKDLIGAMLETDDPTEAIAALTRHAKSSSRKQINESAMRLMATTKVNRYTQ